MNNDIDYGVILTDDPRIGKQARNNQDGFIGTVREIRRYANGSELIEAKNESKGLGCGGPAELFTILGT